MEHLYDDALVIAAYEAQLARLAAVGPSDARTADPERSLRDPALSRSK
jgi:hypothetical protein